MKVGDVEVGEVDDLDQDLAGLSLGPKISTGKLLKSHQNCRPIDLKTCVVSFIYTMILNEHSDLIGVVIARVCESAS